MTNDRIKIDRFEHDAIVSSIPEPTVYSGTMMENLAETVDKTGRNRKATRRKFSTFNLMLILIGSAIIIVLYISNVIKVSQLLAEVNALEMRHRRISMEQELLRAQVNRLSALERVRKLSEEQLGLKNPKNPPVWIKVDEEKIRSVEEAKTDSKRK
ncbi:MAG: hypothetical protein HYY49_12480 [Ignavibacteriales bacterium]|nr:hypothetical protein [Ignavibacteriales bacterium]